MKQKTPGIACLIALLLSVACGFGEAVELQRALDSEYGYSSVRISRGDARVKVTITDSTFSPTLQERSQAQAELLAGFIARRYSPVQRADSLILILTDAETTAEQPGVGVKTTWRGRFSFGASQLERLAAETRR